MDKNDIKNLIDNKCCNVSRDNLNRFLKNHFPEEHKYILDTTQFLNKFDVPEDKNKRISVFERLYCLYNDLTDRPKCKVCGVEYVCGFNKQTNEYKKWCCPKCQATDKDCIDKSKATRELLYGSETYNGTEKAKQTRIEKYGSYHNIDFASKVKSTKLTNHGDENFVNVDKAKSTKLALYGSENYTNLDKARKTKDERYGDQNYNNRNKFKQTLGSFTEEKKCEILQKRKDTNKIKYGCEFVTQNDDVMKRIQETTLNRYGVKCILQSDKVIESNIVLKKKHSWKFILKNTDYTPLFSYDEYVENRDSDKIWKWKHSCGHEFESRYDDGTCSRCPKCYPSNKIGTSKMEIEIYNYIKSIVKCTVLNHTPENRRVIDSGELDIYIPDMKLAVEFNGLYYHSESNGKNKSYHVKKTEECMKKGIRLIHIFEDEYVNHKNIVLSKLKNMLVNNKRSIFARKCSVIEIDNATKNKFVEKYHIQGSDISSVRLGLEYNGHLVAVMTFIKSRFNKNYEWELSRYCTVSNFTIVGGASKLLKYFERNYTPKSIITFADRRWSVGNMYYKIGFTLKNISSPDYFYVKHGIRYSRLMFQKHKLKDILDNFDQDLTEAENMKKCGYDRIFDCGNYVFVKTYSK